MKLLCPLSAFLLIGTSLISSAHARELVLLHFGDSNTITSYLPESRRVNSALQLLLAQHYPKQPVRCVNAGQDGDYIRRFLDEGRYRKVQAANPRMDIAFIRYGQNDMKHYKPDEFEAHLKEFVGVLRRDYPGVHIFLETGIYIDGRHWYDQTQDASRYANDKYQKYWAVTRKVAAELNLPLIDQWRRWDVETRAGLWDLRIRNGTHADDPAHPQHFYNAHANSTGVILYALEICRHLLHYFPRQLPAAGQPAADPHKIPVPPPAAAGMQQVKPVDDALKKTSGAL
ncbi:MAG: SGNH/GDSL hydrolase family protein [Planctomycetes bacterium]|nr:SGNH/GDSL hydrolase family protein [Planctomycetota bacterium]